MVGLVRHALCSSVGLDGRQRSSQWCIRNIVLSIEASFGREGGIDLEDWSAVEVPLDET